MIVALIITAVLLSIISFRPRNRETTQDKARSSVRVTGFDPMNKKALGAYVGDGDEKNDVKLDDTYSRFSGVDASKSAVILDSDKQKAAERTNTGGFLDADMVYGKTLVTPIRSGEEIDNLANSVKKRANNSAETAELKVELDPLAELNTVVTIDKVLKRHKGNWFVEGIVDDIQGNMATTTFELARNSEKGADAKSNKANKSIGGSKNKKPPS